MLRDNVTLELKLVYEDSFNRFTSMDDCDISDFVECLNRISRLKENGWDITVSKLEYTYEEIMTTTLTIKAQPKDSELWCDHRFIFIKKKVDVNEG